MEHQATYPNEWAHTSLGSLIEKVIDNRGKNPPYSESGFEVIETSCISGNNKFPDYSLVRKFVDAETHNHWFRSGHPKKEDLLIITVGNGIGSVAIMNEDRGVLTQNLIGLRFKKNEACSNFLFYYLNQPSIQDFLSSMNIGSAQPSLKVPHLLGIDVPIPSIPEQKAIATILSSLDDKIDLLHRQNKTLEAMAETLFRQWFVEEAQEDWIPCTIDDVATIKGGTTPSTKNPEYWDGNIYWTSPRDLSNHTSVFLFDTERKITEEGLSQIGSGLMPKGSVLMSSRAPIGYLTITDIEVAVNQGYIAIVCNKKLPNFFMYLWCKCNMEEIKNAGNGSTFEEISKSNFKSLALTMPGDQKLDEFSSLVSPIFDKIKTNQKQIKTIERMRDALLPKLMNGEIRVNY